MSQLMIYFSKEENRKLLKYMAQWKLSKHNTVKKMIQEYSPESERRSTE